MPRINNWLYMWNCNSCLSLEKKEFLYGENGDILINTVGNKIFSNYNYYFPDLSHYQTYNVLLFIFLGAGVIYLLDYYDKKHKS